MDRVVAAAVVHRCLISLVVEVEAEELQLAAGLPETIMIVDNNQISLHLDHLDQMVDFCQDFHQSSVNYLPHHIFISKKYLQTI